jgi:hypothetical protein
MGTKPAPKREMIRWGFNIARQSWDFTDSASGETLRSVARNSLPESIIELGTQYGIGVKLQRKMALERDVDGGAPSRDAKLAEFDTLVAAMQAGEWEVARVSLTPEQRMDAAIAEVRAVWGLTKTGADLTIEQYVARRIANVKKAGGVALSEREIIAEMAKNATIAGLIAERRAAALKTRMDFDDIE